MKINILCFTIILLLFCSCDRNEINIETANYLDSIIIESNFNLNTIDSLRKIYKVEDYFDGMILFSLVKDNKNELGLNFYNSKKYRFYLLNVAQTYNIYKLTRQSFENPNNVNYELNKKNKDILPKEDFEIEKKSIKNEILEDFEKNKFNNYAEVWRLIVLGEIYNFFKEYEKSNFYLFSALDIQSNNKIALELITLNHIKLDYYDEAKKYYDKISYNIIFVEDLKEKFDSLENLYTQKQNEVVRNVEIINNLDSSYIYKKIELFKNKINMNIEEMVELENICSHYSNQRDSLLNQIIINQIKYNTAIFFQYIDNTKENCLKHEISKILNAEILKSSQYFTEREIYQKLKKQLRLRKKIKEFWYDILNGRFENFE